MLSVPLSPHHVFTNPEAPQNHLGFLWRLHYFSGVDYTTSSPSPP